MQGRFEEGQKRVREALDIALKHNITDAASEIYRRIGSSYEYASDYPGAVEAYHTALNYCRTQGEEFYAQVCLGCMSYAMFQTGDWKRSVEVSKEVMSRDQSPSGSRTVAIGILGLIRTLRGETREARNLMETCLNMSQSLDIAAMELLGLWGFAMIEENENNYEKAEAYYSRLLKRWETTQDLHDIIPALCTASTFFSHRSMQKETIQCAEALAKIAAATGNPEAVAGLSHALGETDLLNENYEEAALQFLQTLDYLERLDIPLARINAEYRAGTAYAKAGKEDIAASHFNHSYSLARKLGARPLASHIRSHMEKLNITANEERNPAKGQRAKRSGLTRRQLEILKLIADGLTDRMIAGQLYLSPRTVEMHVFNLLNRLDCRNRSEAVRKAAELDLL
jgi:ATP/maltotriose-dependent transcriptional regulator MalT